MKIAHLIPQFYPHIGGAEVCVHNISRTLAEKGHETVVVTTSLPPKKAANLSYRIEYLWEKTCGMFRRLPLCVGNSYLHYALGKLQKKYQFDVWQVTNGWPLGISAVDFFRKNKIPCVLRCCGDDIQTFPEINYGVRLNMRSSNLIEKYYPLYDAFIANSTTMKGEYEKLKISSTKITVIPNGVNFARFASLVPNKNIHKKMDVLILLTVGRNHPKKGFSIIPEVVNILKSNGVNFQWIVVGRGNSRLVDSDKMQELKIIEDCGESELKGFDLPSDKLISIYKSADLFIFPSLMEGYPTVCIEAMAAGLPVIGSDSPGVRDIIRNRIDGLLVEEHSANAYFSAIISLLNDKEKFCHMRKAAMEKAINQDWGLIASRYIDVYSEILRH